MVFDTNAAAKIAEYLLQVRAVKLSPRSLFTWASGWKSPIYCDNRITLSYPTVRTFICREFQKAILVEFGRPDYIAAVATGGIAQGALVAEGLNVPFVYVRTSAKEHGTGQLIEGRIESGASVVVVEDLVSTGASSLKAVNILQDVGCVVKGMAAVFTYGLDVAIANFKKQECKLVTLSDYDHLLEVALAKKFITEKDLKILTQWRANPSEQTSQEIDF